MPAALCPVAARWLARLGGGPGRGLSPPVGRAGLDPVWAGPGRVGSVRPAWTTRVRCSVVCEGTYVSLSRSRALRPRRRRRDAPAGGPALLVGLLSCAIAAYQILLLLALLEKIK